MFKIFKKNGKCVEKQTQNDFLLIIIFSFCHLTLIESVTANIQRRLLEIKTWQPPSNEVNKLQQRVWRSNDCLICSSWWKLRKRHAFFLRQVTPWPFYNILLIPFLHRLIIHKKCCSDVCFFRLNIAWLTYSWTAKTKKIKSHFGIIANRNKKQNSLVE